MRDNRNAIWTTSDLGPDETRVGPVKVSLLVVDERLYGEYQKIGLDMVALQPDVLPVR